MKETTTITIPYPPTSDIICSLINKGWVIDSIESESCPNYGTMWAVKAHSQSSQPDSEKREAAIKAFNTYMSRFYNKRWGE